MDQGAEPDRESPMAHASALRALIVMNVTGAIAAAVRSLHGGPSRAARAIR
jgi:hypothetical protein